MCRNRLLRLLACAGLLLALPGCGAVFLMANQAGQVAMAMEAANTNRPYGVVFSNLATIDGTIRPVDRVVVAPNTTSDRTALALAAYLESTDGLEVIGPDAALVEMIRQRFFSLPDSLPTTDERVQILRTVAERHDADAAIWLEPTGSRQTTGRVQEVDAVMRIISAPRRPYLLEQGFVVQINRAAPVVDIGGIHRDVAKSVSTQVVGVFDASARRRLDLATPSRPPDDGFRTL